MIKGSVGKKDQTKGENPITGIIGQGPQVIKGLGINIVSIVHNDEEWINRLLSLKITHYIELEYGLLVCLDLYLQKGGYLFQYIDISQIWGGNKDMREDLPLLVHSLDQFEAQKGLSCAILTSDKQILLAPFKPLYQKTHAAWCISESKKRSG